MASTSRHDAWSAGDSYEYYMGRWSRAIAAEFVTWLDQPAELDWLDVGCGTGALAATILDRCSPRSVLGVDPSEGFVAHARADRSDPRARFEVAGAEALPCADRAVDVVASALALNFVPDRARALAEMRRVTRPGGTVSLYVWDYPGGGMGFISAFWRAAAALDPAAAALAEDRRFPFCTGEALLAEVADAGLADPVAECIEVTTHFPDFAAFWHPFTLGAGPAPGYCASLTDDARLALRRRLEADLDVGGGPVALPARAWAVRARAV
ncbi:MAG: class I SAM-dependent methyltransferase [Ectothiorhodospiraceae bacterium]|nr:class I SAM-dependent methyltransferase [Ectothiorhodospiraceae bacterium]